MIAAPIVIDKLRGAYELYLKPQPLLRILAQPRSVSDFEFEDAAGRTLSLKDLKGKYSLLNVWATWCPPCRKEMPSLDRFQSLVLGKSQLRVVALSVDRGGFPQLQAFYDVIGVKSLDLYRGDEPSVLSALGIAGLPTTLLLNPDGKEIARLVGPTEWDEPQILTQILGLINTNG
ncbi:MAG: TlpA disulfide reductase family protein [Hyphomicrobiales bacterium]|jgi:thiol-disulfide isomerase/thioredoxin